MSETEEDSGLVLVTRNDFLDSFPNGASNANDYHKAFELSHSGSSEREIAHSIQRSPYTVKEWLRTEKRPRAVSALETAVKLGIVPLSTRSQKFKALNRMAAKVYWTGSSAESSYGNYHVVIRSNPANLSALKNYFERELGYSMNVFADVNELRGGENEAVFGRVLDALDLQDQEQRRLPQYIVKLLSDFHEGQEGIQDFTRVLFEEKFYHRNRKFWLYLPSCQSQSEAQQYGEQVVELLTTVLPKLSLSPDNVYSYPRDSGRVGPIISLRKENILNLMEYYSSFLTIEAPKQRLE